ncbi:MAG: SoxY-related AACIE arm protein [Henriciella sp.]
MRDVFNKPILSRRSALCLGAGAALVAVTPLRGLADEPEMQAAIKDVFGDRLIEDGKVTLRLPPISENGYSVPLTVAVDSPMTGADHVNQIVIFSPRNPLPNIARFKLSAQSGKAEIATRVRLSGTQALTAIAETNDGRLWRGSAETVVTLAACVIL